MMASVYQGLRAIITLVLITNYLNADDFGQKLEKYIQNLVDCKNITGLTVAVVKGNETVYQGGFGYQTLDTKQPVTNRTLFNIGSNSKAFTATLAADAVGHNKLGWDQPLRSIFGKDFQLQDEFRTAQASIRDLLAHKLGMPSYWGVTTAVMNFTREEIVKRFRYFPVKYGFRERFLYSNYPFVLAAAAIETVTGEKWEDAIYNTIYKPLGMTNARIGATMTDDDWSNTAWSYTWINKTWVKNPEKTNIRTVVELGPAAGVFINADDMSKWMKFHISGGKDQHGKQIVSMSALQETYRPTMASLDGRRLYKPKYPVDNYNPTYALAWRNGIYRGRRTIYHTGSYSSYASRLILFPDEDIGVWSAVSTDAPFVQQYNVNRLVSWFAIDLLLGKEPWLNETTACEFPAPWNKRRRRRRTVAAPEMTTLKPPTNSSVHLNLSEYLGDYFHRGFGKLTVFLDENNKLKFKFGVLLHGLLLPTSTPDKFNQRLDFPLVFRLRSSGYDFFFIRNKQQVVVGTNVPYMESRLPPTFFRSGFDSELSITTPSPTPGCKPNINSAPVSTCQIVLQIISLLTVIYNLDH